MEIEKRASNQDTNSNHDRILVGILAKENVALEG